MTICTENREKCLAMIASFVGADDSVRPCATSEMFEYKLMPLGEMVKECLERLEDRDGGVMVDEYVIMPNHIHVVIRLNEGTGGQSRPPLQRLIQRFKSITTRRGWEMGRRKLWQRSYYDHVIRCQEDYIRICEYINNNPAKWAEDEYYYAE